MKSEFEVTVCAQMLHHLAEQGAAALNQIVSPWICLQHVVSFYFCLVTWQQKKQHFTIIFCGINDTGDVSPHPHTTQKFQHQQTRDDTLSKHRDRLWTTHLKHLSQRLLIFFFQFCFIQNLFRSIFLALELLFLKMTV